MPNRDGTGPLGKGPRTGRGAGRCKDDETGYNSEGYRRRAGFGRRPGRRNGRGFGRGRM